MGRGREVIIYAFFKVEVKSVIIYIIIGNPPGNYEQTFKCKWFHP